MKRKTTSMRLDLDLRDRVDQAAPDSTPPKTRTRYYEEGAAEKLAREPGNCRGCGTPLNNAEGKLCAECRANASGA